MNWIDHPEAFLTYSFVDVVNGKAPPTAFTNKLVLVGITATGFDPIQTPFNKKAPTGGVYLQAAEVYLQAAEIDNLLNQRFLILLLVGVTNGMLIAIAIVTSGILFHCSCK